MWQQAARVREKERERDSLHVARVRLNCERGMCSQGSTMDLSIFIRSQRGDKYDWEG